MEGEIESLRKERCVLMQEVVDLQQQNRGTVQHMEAVNQRLQAAEGRQKQMVSFLAKLLQNPSFLARLQQKKEIGSPRMRRKFVKQQQEMAQPDSSEGQIVKRVPEWQNFDIADPNPFPTEQAPDHLLEGLVGKLDLGMDSASCQYENITSDDEQRATHRYIGTQQQLGEQVSVTGAEEPFLRGKEVMNPQEEIGPDYFVSFPDEFVKEKNFPEFSSPGFGQISNQENIWSTGFDANAGASSSINELWGNVVNYDVPELGMTERLSDIWDLAMPQVAGGSGTDDWQAMEPPLDELDSNPGEQKDYTSKNP